MKLCNRICDVANDGICMGVCAMGLNTQGYRVAYHENNVYLLHNTLNGSLTQFPQSDTEKHDRLVEFVKQQQVMDNTWQAFQWFDLEDEPAKHLEITCKILKQSGQQFDNQVVEQLLKDSPFDDDVDVQQLVEQFNDMLSTLH